MTKKLSTEYKLDSVSERKQLEFFAREPWLSPSNLTVNLTIPGYFDCKTDEEKLAVTLAHIRSISPRLIIYTDGSAKAGTTKEGAGVVLTEGDSKTPHTLDKVTVKGARRTASYIEEVAAMEMACKWLEEKCQEESVLICTDSLSMCQALDALNEDVDGTIRRIAKLKLKLVVQWVPAYVGVPGNEAALH